MMRLCWWSWPFAAHPAETAVQFLGDTRPACYRHRANIELARIASRRLCREFEQAMTRVLDVLETPVEQIDGWARKLRAL